MSYAVASDAVAFFDGRPDLVYRSGPTVGRFLSTVQRLALLIAANQVGKTLGLCKWANDRCLEYDGSGPGVLLAMIADIDNQFAVFCSKLHEVCARSELDAACKYIDGKGFYTHGRRMVRYRNGARIEFRGGKGEQMSAASVTCDLGVVVDEIPQRGHFAEALRATQRWMSPVRVGFTAVGRPADWFRARVEGIDGAPPEDAHPETGEALWEVFNCGLTKEECPWMTDEQIALIYGQVDPAEAPQRLHGAWEGPTPGRRFNGMSPECVIPALPPGEWTVTVTMDHGEGGGKQWVNLLYSRVLPPKKRGGDKVAQVVVVDEYVNPHATTPAQDAEGIEAMLSRNGLSILHVDRWFGDINSSGKSSAGASVNAEFESAFARRLGIGPDMPSPVSISKPAKSAGSVDFGERLLNYALLRRELLFVEASTVRTQRIFWHYTKGDQSTKHGVDTVRYGALDELRNAPAYANLYLNQ